MTPVDASSRIFLARSFPMPGSSRSCASVICATPSPHAAMVSAADRYARILNAFSPLISSRSAISPRTCATARLSTREAVPLDAIVEQPGAAGSERFTDGAVCLRRAIAEHAAAAAGAADLGRGGPGRHGAADEVVDRGRRDAGRQPLPVVPLLGDEAAHRVPVAVHERRPHRRGGVADSLE